MLFLEKSCHVKFLKHGELCKSFELGGGGPTEYYYIHRGTGEPCACWGSQQLLEGERLASLVHGYHKFLDKVNIYPSFIKHIYAK